MVATPRQAEIVTRGLEEITARASPRPRFNSAVEKRSCVVVLVSLGGRCGRPSLASPPNSSKGRWYVREDKGGPPSEHPLARYQALSQFVRAIGNHHSTIPVAPEGQVDCHFPVPEKVRRVMPLVSVASRIESGTGGRGRGSGPNTPPPHPLPALQPREGRLREDP